MTSNTFHKKYFPIYLINTILFTILKYSHLHLYFLMKAYSINEEHFIIPMNYFALFLLLTDWHVIQSSKCSVVITILYFVTLFFYGLPLGAFTVCGRYMYTFLVIRYSSVGEAWWCFEQKILEIYFTFFIVSLTILIMHI